MITLINRKMTKGNLMKETVELPLGRNIRKLLQQKGMTQQELAEKVGISRVYLSDLIRGKKGKRIPQKTLQKIAQALGVSVGELLTSPEEKKNIEIEKREDLVIVPVISGVPASGFQGGDVEIIDYLPTPREVLNGIPEDRVAWVKVLGDSMEPKVSRGDLVLIADGSWVEVKNGDLVIAVMDGEKTLKKFYDKGDYILLVPENKNYEPLMIPKDKLKEANLYLYKVLGIFKRF